MNLVNKTGLLLGGGLVLFSLTHSAHAQRVSPLTGQKLASMCSRNSHEKLCGAYLAGIVDGAAWSQNFGLLEGQAPAAAFCVPQDVKGTQIRSLIAGWFAGHEDTLGQPAGRGVYRALHDNYACPTGMAHMYVEKKAQAQRISSLQGSGLVKLCSHKATAGMCDGYLAGTMDSEVWSRNFNTVQGANGPVAFCVPEAMKGTQIRSLVVGWYAGHEEAMEQPAGRGVYRALHDNYPCQSTISPAAPAQPGEKK